MPLVNAIGISVSKRFVAGTVSGIPGAIDWESGVGIDWEDGTNIDWEGTIADVTAPILSSPTITAIDDVSAAGTVTTNEANGTLFWALTPTSTPPSSAQIIAGTGGGIAKAGSQAVSATGLQNVSFTGLTASTVCFPHYVHRDAANNVSAVSSAGVSITTASSSTHGADNIGGSGLTVPTLTNTGGTTTGLLTWDLSGLYNPQVGDTLTLTINGVDYPNLDSTGAVGPLDANDVTFLTARFDTPTLDNGAYKIWVKHTRGANYVYSNTIFVVVNRPLIAPTVTSNLIISGGGTVGDTAVIATPAVVTGYPTTYTRTYQWKVDGVNVATGNSYLTTGAGALTCVETISNGVAPSATSTSNTVNTSLTNGVQWEDAVVIDWEDGINIDWET